MPARPQQPLQATEIEADPASEKRLAWETLRERDLEEKMGQGGAHARRIDLFVSILRVSLAEQQRPAYVGWDVFVEWDPSDPRARVSPDTFLLEGQPADLVPSIWQTWQPGCDPPRFALEVVSDRSRVKDYEVSPLRYAALGVEELAVYDAEPRGPEAYAVQLYRRNARGQFLRAYAGPGPVESLVLGRWLVVTEGGLRLARDAQGQDLVPSFEERAHAAEERVSVAEERATAAEGRATAAEDRLRALEEELGRLRGAR
jgi:Uma2 family endonuclease